MVKVFIVDTNLIDLNKQYMLSDSRKNKLESFQDDIKIKQNIGIELALNSCIKSIDNSYNLPVKYYYLENGKPVLNDLNYFISLSHSGSYCVCAISDEIVGIDIERIDDRDYQRLIKRLCKDNNLENQKSDDFFATFWTINEAYFKATGNIISSIKEVDLEISNIDIDSSYKCSLVSKSKDKIEINFCKDI